MIKVLRILALLTLIWLTIPVIAERGRPSGPRPKDGNYTLTIAGFIRTNGEVGGTTVLGDQVNLEARVVSNRTGQSGMLSAPNLKLNGSHFSGDGSVLGQGARFNGRIDFPDSDKEHAIRGVRLVCTVKTTSGDYARLIGYVPALAAVKDNIDAENARDRDRDRPPPKD
jgi:hypothetical protein